MPAAWKTVRVFISSTFRDMHAERDNLVKVVFPALREKLEKYRIHLVDIDLRWGVTAEQADNDQVLDLCLQQIDECRPFFIGILGDRYGWVPDEYPDEAVSKYDGCNIKPTRASPSWKSSTASCTNTKCTAGRSSTFATTRSQARYPLPSERKLWRKTRPQPKVSKP